METDGCMCASGSELMSDVPAAGSAHGSDGGDLAGLEGGRRREEREKTASRLE